MTEFDGQLALFTEDTTCTDPWCLRLSAGGCGCLLRGDPPGDAVTEYHLWNGERHDVRREPREHW